MTVSRSAHRLLLASVVLPFVVSDMAFAQQQQEPDPNVTVNDRPRPEYDALGLRAGSFVIFPEITVTETYSDNVGFDEDNEQSDFITEIEPSVEFRSDWSRHRLSLEVGSDIAIHLDESDEDFEDFFAVGAGRLDVSRQTNLTATVQARQAHEDRADPEDNNNDQLTDFYQYGGSLAASHQLNRVTLTLSGEAERSSFEDNDDEDRDSWVYDALLRSTYDLSPNLDLFVEGRYNIEDRDENVDDNGVERDTDGYEGRVGAGLNLTSVLFGEGFVGYRVQRFEDDDFDDEKGISLGLDFNWNPTGLTSIGLSGQRDFRPTDEAGAASNLRTELGVSIDHELKRNLIIGAKAAYQNDDFQGDVREDDTYLAGVGLTLWLNRNLSLKGGYDFSTRNSNVDGEDFDVNEFSIGLTARL